MEGCSWEGGGAQGNVPLLFPKRVEKRVRELVLRSIKKIMKK